MTLPTPPADFATIAQLIAAAKQRAVLAVNTTLIELYWQIGEHISLKIAASEWGDGVVEQLAPIWRKPSPAYVASPAAICSGCGSFTKPMRATK